MKNNTLPIFLLIIAFGVMFLLVLQLPGVIQLPKITNNASALSLIAIFLTGLITGGLTCLAVQGGLLASSIASRAQEDMQDKVRSVGYTASIITFLVSKLIAYTLFGFLLGLLGSVLELSIETRVILQFAVVIFMVGTAMNLLQIHPIFRYFALTPPRFINRFIRKNSKSSNLFAPAFLGALTVFIPCGTTQAMMALSIASGSPFLGALILFTFILGTTPLFFILGYSALKAGRSLNQNFMKVAAVVIILLALYSLDGALALSGSKYTFQNVLASISGGKDSMQVKAVEGNAVIVIDGRGYTPSVLEVKKGSRLHLTIKNEDGYGCQQAFVIPSINFQKIIAPGSEDEVTFTVPDTVGEIPFMCSMGMYRGVIKVI